MPSKSKLRSFFATFGSVACRIPIITARQSSTTSVITPPPASVTLPVTLDTTDALKQETHTGTCDPEIIQESDQVSVHRSSFIFMDPKQFYSHSSTSWKEVMSMTLWTSFITREPPNIFVGMWQSIDCASAKNI